jgi:hypothetical protein
VISALAVIAGNGFTVTIAVSVLEQPAEFVPVMVYVVVAVGVTVTVAPNKGPGLQV